jgi:ABC-type Fe3+-siderophore transport system permease subunit
VSVVTQARLAGALCALVVLVGVISVLAGIRGAQLTDIQLGTNPAHVQRLVSDSTVRHAANRAIAIDYFFIAAYWAAFVALAALLRRRAGVWAAIAVLAAATATATAALDVVENVRTSGVLALYRPDSHLGQKQLDALRHVSLAKWATAATTVTLLAGLFAPRSKIAAVGLAMLVVAGIGFAGVLFHPLIEVYLVGVGVMASVIAVVLLAREPPPVRGS